MPATPLLKTHFELAQTIRKYFCVAVAFLCEINHHGDEFSMHYQLACVHADSDTLKRTHSIETYSSKTGEWKESLVTASLEFCFGPKVAKVIKGVFFWMEWNRHMVVVYNSRNNTEGHLKLIELPSLLIDELYDHVKPFLDYVVCEARDSKVQLILFDSEIKAWLLDEKTGGRADIVKANCWTLIYRINLTSVLNNVKYLSLVCIHLLEDHEEVIFLNSDFEVKSFKHYEQPVRPLLF